MSESNGGVATTSKLTLFPMTNWQTGITGFFAFDPTKGFNDPVSASTHSFRTEDLLSGRIHTVNRIVVTYRDLGKVSASFILSGASDQQQIVSVSKTVSLGNTVSTNKLLVYIVGISLSAMNLQLTVNRAANAGPLSIVKIVMCGKLDATQL